MNRQINPNHCYKTADGVMYMLEPVAGEPGWHVTKNGERYYRHFTSLAAATGWLEHVLEYGEQTKLKPIIVAGGGSAEFKAKLAAALNGGGK